MVPGIQSGQEEKAAELAKLSSDCEITVFYVIDGQTFRQDVLHNPDRDVVEEKEKQDISR